MARRCVWIGSIVLIVVARIAADETLYRYEGEVLPTQRGWLDGGCENPCKESVEDGHFVLRFSGGGDLANYTHIIAGDFDPPPPPPTRWVEWRFRSNHPIGENFFNCDARFTVRFREIFDSINMYGDAVISASGDTAVLGLDITEFHTFRFESLDGINYEIAVDGSVFLADADIKISGGAFLQLLGQGGCDGFQNTVNEWDLVRYGTLSTGEQIIASDPPAGFLDPEQHAGLDRFTVTFDSANYVYVDEITVEVTGGFPPIVIQTGRREDTEPDTVEIVLDRPLAMGETTRFTFDDGATVNVIEYTFAPGDTNGDGLVDLRDVAEFQNCFRRTAYLPTCAALDLVRDGVIRLDDLTPLTNELSGP